MRSDTENVTDGEQADVALIGAASPSWMYVCNLVSTQDFYLLSVMIVTCFIRVYMGYLLFVMTPELSV